MRRVTDGVPPVSPVGRVRHTPRVNEESREGERQPPGGNHPKERTQRPRNDGGSPPPDAGTHVDEYA